MLDVVLIVAVRIILPPRRTVEPPDNTMIGGAGKMSLINIVELSNQPSPLKNF
jgi:hypothetical protein